MNNPNKQTQTCEELGHNIIHICGIWCTTCRDFPKVWVMKDPLLHITISDKIDKE